MATCYAAAGIVMAFALRRPSWRAPAFALATIQFALHSANHLLDIGRAHPRWVGYVDFAALLAATIQLALLWRAADRDARYAATGADGRIPTPSSSSLPLAPAPERRST